MFKPSGQCPRPIMYPPLPRTQYAQICITWKVVMVKGLKSGVFLENKSCSTTSFSTAERSPPIVKLYTYQVKPCILQNFRVRILSLLRPPLCTGRRRGTKMIRKTTRGWGGVRGGGIWTERKALGKKSPPAAQLDRKSTRLNSSHAIPSRMPSSA